ncbi:MAG: pyridine nucleotide-disulfide oxidoreductase, partial [Polaromonas sp.]|nr:pyridine nucleotide-disulfide oxidoreductase [Polaromonas sp.]
MNLRKLIIAVLLLAGIAAFFALDLGRYFSLAFLKESQASFTALFNQRPVMVALVFFAVYVAVTALSLPGAAIMTLAGGASFGLVWGTVVVSFASTVGATLAMLVARYLLRDAIQARFGRRLDEVNKGI